MENEKTFTQEEVNKIVARRLNEDRQQRQQSHSDSEYMELETKYNDLLQQVHADNVARTQAAKKAAIVEALTKEKALCPSEMAIMLQDKIVENQDGTLSFRQTDGQTVSIQEGVSAWAKANLWAIRADLQGGTGSRLTPHTYTDEEATLREAMGLHS